MRMTTAARRSSRSQALGRGAGSRGPASSRSRPGAGKSPTNLSLRVDLVERARALGLNLSQVVESSLEAAIAAAEQARWLADNEVAIDEYNAFVERYGVFGDDHRPF